MKRMKTLHYSLLQMALLKISQQALALTGIEIFLPLDLLCFYIQVLRYNNVYIISKYTLATFSYNVHLSFKRLDLVLPFFFDI